MKFHRFVPCAAFAILATSAQAAIYTVRNGSGSAASGIQDTLGRTFQGTTTVGQSYPSGGGVSAGPGVVAFGFFSASDAVLPTLNLSQLVNSFQMFGAEGVFSSAGPTGNRGIFNVASGQQPVSSTPFELRPIYFFAGNGSTLANSTEVLVVRSDTYSFDPTDDSVPTPITISFAPANSTVLVGSVVPNVQTANVDASTTPGWQMIPEPSVAIMMPLAALTILRRRRRA